MDTVFRTWMTTRDTWGYQPDLCAFLQSEFLREQEQPHKYAGEVAICRDNDDWQNAVQPEAVAVYGLYHLCREQSQRCLTIGNQRYWLLGYQWPNQESYKRRCADLVGLTEDGALVVFECKRGNRGCTPMAAILEGLDYLSCLTSKANFPRIQQKVSRWQQQKREGLHSRFHDLELKRQNTHEVIVLADKSYFGNYIGRHEGQRGAGLRQFARGAREFRGRLRLDFAVTDFNAPTANWLDVN